MAYDETLAGRMRGILAKRDDVVEKRMFGGLAFMVRGHMACGLVGDELMVRAGPDAYGKLLEKPHARPMDFTGRPMKGFLYVGPAALVSSVALARWMQHGIDFAESLPAKEPGAKAKRPRARQGRSS